MATVVSFVRMAVWCVHRNKPNRKKTNGKPTSVSRIVLKNPMKLTKQEY